MKHLKFLPAMLSIVFVVGYFPVSVSGQSAEDKNKIATISGSGLSVRWFVAAPHSALTMTISAPDGRVFSKEFKSGSSPDFTLIDKEGNRLPDGQYSYELRLTPVFSKVAKEALAAARGTDNEAEAVRATRKRGALPAQPLVESGSFSILNGALIVAGAVEEGGPRPTSKSMQQLRLPGASEAAFSKLRLHHLSRMAMPDQVIPDDLIVQGSVCVGFDCVNNESFGFDTIRLKENNTRIKFEDTSVGAFPTNDWQLTANDSASGGASRFSIDDVTGAKTPFTISAGAATNSIFVDSTGRLGLRTSTPALDIHVNTSDTPATRLEQNSSGGFTAQTWDVAGNEANFFVRDVTGGSRLPFRIRPGAPTSSIDISASGNVGIGTASPQRLVQIHATATPVLQMTDNTSGTTRDDGFQIVQAGLNTFLENQEPGTMNFRTSAIDRMTITATGNVGIATASPTDTLSVNGTASKPGGGSWAVFSDERLKTVKGNFTSGVKAVMQLQPIRYEYLPNNALGITSKGEHIGFGAQALQKIIPQAVTTTDQGYLLINNDPIIWTMLNAIKDQQKEIEQLKAQVRHLRTSHKRR